MVCTPMPDLGLGGIAGNSSWLWKGVDRVGELRRFAAAIALCAASVPLNAEAQAENHTHRQLPQHEVPGKTLSVEVAYTADIWHNSGGVEDGTRYLDNLDLIAQLDLERAIGWQGAKAHAYVLYNGNSSLSELTGDSQVASNIETGVRALRLYEFWIEAPLGQNANLKLGLYDLNSEFDALETSSLFVGSAHGIGTDISQTGKNGPSIFPSTSLAARLQLGLAENLAIRAAVLDGVPGDPLHPARTAIKLGGGDGALLISEIDFGNADRRLIAGAWGYTSRFETHDSLSTAGSSGYYLRGEAKIASPGNGALRGFFRLGAASGEVNPFDRFASAGLSYEIENQGKFGLAAAHARFSRDFRIANPGTEAAETSLELTYARDLAPWLQIQPNLQWVLNPSGDPTLDNALVFGLRLTIAP